MKKCGSCEHLDVSTMYCSDPPQFKCEYYGCIVCTDDECRAGQGMKKKDREAVVHPALCIEGRDKR